MTYDKQANPDPFGPRLDPSVRAGAEGEGKSDPAPSQVDPRTAQLRAKLLREQEENAALASQVGLQGELLQAQKGATRIAEDAEKKAVVKAYRSDAKRIAATAQAFNSRALVKQLEAKNAAQAKELIEAEKKRQIAEDQAVALALVNAASHCFGTGFNNGHSVAGQQAPVPSRSPSPVATVINLDVIPDEKTGRSCESKTPEDTAHFHKKKRAAGAFKGTAQSPNPNGVSDSDDSEELDFGHPNSRSLEYDFVNVDDNQESKEQGQDSEDDTPPSTPERQ